MANKSPANAGFFFIPLSPPIQRTDHPQPTPCLFLAFYIAVLLANIFMGLRFQRRAS